jgi:hypothetical protein
MINIRSNILLLLLFLGISGAFAQAPVETIPDFTIFRQDKTPFTQKDLSKDKLLFFVFFDVTCEHCRDAIQQINKEYATLKNINIHLITLDMPEQVNTFLKKYGKNLLFKSNVMLFYDVKNEFIVKFKPRKYPSIFLYTPQKKLILYDDNPDNLPTFFGKIKAYKS